MEISFINLERLLPQMRICNGQRLKTSDILIQWSKPNKLINMHTTITLVMPIINLEWEQKRYSEWYQIVYDNDHWISLYRH